MKSTNKKLENERIVLELPSDALGYSEAKIRIRNEAFSAKSDDRNHMSTTLLWCKSISPEVHQPHPESALNRSYIAFRRGRRPFFEQRRRATDPISNSSPPHRFIRRCLDRAPGSKVRFHYSLSEFVICPWGPGDAASFLFVRLRRAEKLFLSESEVEGPINLQSDRNKAASALAAVQLCVARRQSRTKADEMQVHTKKPWDSIWDAIKSHSLARKLLIRRRFVCVITLCAGCQREHLLLHWTHSTQSGGNFTNAFQHFVRP